ncbi:MAG TPA: ATP-binding protein [Mycobacteriales bacterium]|nr:ATP-binding protein [Mycobacteriales bacterium]
MLEPSRSAPALARRAVHEFAYQRFSQETSETAELLTSELVTNAVTHGWGPVTVAVSGSGRQLSVAVGDANPAPPVVRPEELEALGGRGLRLVGSLAKAWGVTARADSAGKEIWFRLA